MITDNEIKNFWDNCTEGLAHITSKRNTPVYYDYLRIILGQPNINFKDKVVVDYGIGNAQLYLILSELGIKKYIGIDISKRSLEAAQKFISDQNLKTDFELLEPPDNFHSLNPDVFLSFATIQHFPSEEYCLDFFHKLNNSIAKELYLQIRENKNVHFNNDYSTEASVTSSTLLNTDYIKPLLNNYKLEWVSDTNRIKIGSLGRYYQFIKFTRK